MLQSWPKLMRKAILFAAFLYTCSAQPIPSYYIVTPGSISPGTNTTVAVHWFGLVPNVNVTAEIMHERKPLVSVQRTFKNDSIGMMTLPAIPENSTVPVYSLVFTGSAENVTYFTTETYLLLKSKRVSIFIELNKSSYKPGQSVKFRTVCLDEDLKPFHGPIDIVVLDPAGSLIQQWLSVQTYLGVASKEFLLSDIPQFGVWAIEVHSDGMHVSKQFSVTDRVLPQFEVTVEMPSVHIVPRSNNITGVITAKYSYGEPVKGNATVTITAPYYTSAIYLKTFEISGTVNFSFNYDELNFMYGLTGHEEWINYITLDINATVTDSLTGMEVNGSKIVSFANSDYRILDNAGPFKPHLNYTVKIQIMRSDMQPMTKQERDQNVSILIIQSAYEHIWNSWDGGLVVYDAPSTPPDTRDQQQYAIPETGLLKIKFPVLASTAVITMQVQYQDTNHTFQARKNYWQLADAFLQLSTQDSPIQVGSPFQLYVESNEKVDKINYVVLCKGEVMAAGKQSTGAFVLTPERSWAPEAVIRVYYIHSSTGEVISASMNISIKVDLKNKVSLSWSRAQAKPSENVSLSINVTEAASLVGLIVAEKTKNLYGADNTITERMVINELMMPYQEVFVLSDAYDRSYTSEMYDNWMGMPMQLPNLDIRFADTWMWQEYNISSEKSTSVQVSVPNSVTTWVATAFVLSEGLGFGLTSEPAELQVKQTFFISMNLPYSVTRGEQFILEVILMNHLQQTMEVTATLQIEDSFELIGASTGNTVANQRRASVPSNSGRTVLFPVRPKQLGEISFTVLANSSEACADITKKVIVKAEGIQKTFSQSVLLEATGSTPQTVSKMLSFTFPSDVVSGSEQAYITVIGDVLGPSIDGLDSLIQMPGGCGEQNMINFSPNIYVLQYLKTTGQLTQRIKETAVGYMNAGYQTELTYRRFDGSFSAFGNGDDSGSTWLSAFVLRCFLQARPFIYIDQSVLQSTIMWLVQYQDSTTGVFSEPGHVIHTELQGGLNGPITLTAYILTALLEDEVYRKQYKAQVSKALEFLEKKFEEGISSNYTLAVVTYSLSLANSTKARSALDVLHGRAERTNGGMFWVSPGPVLPYYWQPSSSEVEMAAYALLSCCQQNRTNEGIPIMKWLSQQRTQLGGYASTQDTIMALQALSQFAALLTSSNTALVVSVSESRSQNPISFQINPGNLLLLQSHKIEIVQPISLNVSALGNGIAVVQLNVIYNVKPTARRRRGTDITDTFSLDITVEDNKSDLNRITVHVCTSYIPSIYGNQSGMALMEVQYLSGFSLDPSKIIQNNLVRKVEQQGGQVNLYFDTISGTPVCVEIPMLRDAKVSGTQDATISIVDYYKPRTKVTRLYTSKVMKESSSCDFCGDDCTSCRSNVVTQNGSGSNSGTSNAACTLSHSVQLSCILLPYLVYLCTIA
ncbi:CD109 antigen-like [Lissotriton helveticus]